MRTIETMTAKDFLKIGDIVEYQGEQWEIGFINHRHFAGTVRLQKSGRCDAKQINYIYPEDLKPFKEVV